TSLQSQVHDKSGSLGPFLGPDCKHPYIYKIATRDSLSRPLRLRRLSLVVLQQTAQPLPTPHRCLSLTQRSANEFKFGLLAGKRIVSILPDSISSRNDAQNFVSRSCNRYRQPRRNPHSTMVAP